MKTKVDLITRRWKEAKAAKEGAYRLKVNSFLTGGSRVVFGQKQDNISILSFLLRGFMRLFLTGERLTAKFLTGRGLFIMIES